MGYLNCFSRGRGGIQSEEFKPYSGSPGASLLPAKEPSKRLPGRYLPRRVHCTEPSMGIVYFRRYRMEIDLAGPLFEQPRLPEGYRLAAWDDRLLDAHAQTKFECFRLEMDANVF